MLGVMGETAKEGTLTMRKAGKEQQEFLVLKMTDVMVTSYQTGGNAGNEAELVDHGRTDTSAPSRASTGRKATDGSLGHAGDLRDRQHLPAIILASRLGDILEMFPGPHRHTV